MSKILLSVVSLIVAVAVAAFLIIDIDKHAAEDVGEGFLKAKVPEQFGKMIGEDKPLAATEEVQRATENILVVSDYLHREYTLADGKKFTLYISYWAKNKEEVHKAATHTPDRCWSSSGWKSDLSKKRGNYKLHISDKELFDAYYREFSYKSGAMREEAKRYVLFWFIVDGKRYDFGTKDLFFADPVKWIKNAIEGALHGSPEQFFIRIDSEHPIESFVNDPDFIALMGTLGKEFLYIKE